MQSPSPLRAPFGPRLYGPLLGLLALSLLSSQALAHSGGTDAKKCHTNRKTRIHHCHNTPKERSPRYSNRDSTLPQKVIEARISAYFREANDGTGALSCGLRKYPRNVSKSLKRRVKQRDGHRCILCKSTIQLEVDHRRALMNGGNNTLSNLATLCDKCHTHKTRMDTSLRRQRKKRCGR